MTYYNNYQVPASYMSPTSQPAYSLQNQGNIVWVQGRASAELYPIAPGNKVMLMDSVDPVIYVKEADQTGKLFPMKIFDLVERKDTVQITQPEPKPIEIDYEKIKDMITTEVCAQIDNLTLSSVKKGGK